MSMDETIVAVDAVLLAGVGHATPDTREAMLGWLAGWAAAVDSAPMGIIVDGPLCRIGWGVTHIRLKCPLDLLLPVLAHLVDGLLEAEVHEATAGDEPQALWRAAFEGFPLAADGHGGSSEVLASRFAVSGALRISVDIPQDARTPGDVEELIAWATNRLPPGPPPSRPDIRKPNSSVRRIDVSRWIAGGPIDPADPAEIGEVIELVSTLRDADPSIAFAIDPDPAAPRWFAWGNARLASSVLDEIETIRRIGPARADLPDSFDLGPVAAACGQTRRIKPVRDAAAGRRLARGICLLMPEDLDSA